MINLEKTKEITILTLLCLLITFAGSWIENYILPIGMSIAYPFFLVKLLKKESKKIVNYNKSEKKDGKPHYHPS
jgi:hypothetical protein